jgi:hypothetical protein
LLPLALGAGWCIGAYGMGGKGWYIDMAGYVMFDPPPPPLFPGMCCGG